jgi:hypothetical protein
MEGSSSRCPNLRGHVGYVRFCSAYDIAGSDHARWEQAARLEVSAATQSPADLAASFNEPSGFGVDDDVSDVGDLLTQLLLEIAA